MCSYTFPPETLALPQQCWPTGWTLVFLFQDTLECWDNSCTWDRERVWKVDRSKQKGKVWVHTHICTPARTSGRQGHFPLDVSSWNGPLGSVTSTTLGRQACRVTCLGSGKSFVVRDTPFIISCYHFPSIFNCGNSCGTSVYFLIPSKFKTS